MHDSKYTSPKFLKSRGGREGGGRRSSQFRLQMVKIFLIFQPEKQFKSSGSFHQQLQDSLFWFSQQRRLCNCKSNCGHLSNGVHRRKHFRTGIQTLQKRWQMLRRLASAKGTRTLSSSKSPWAHPSPLKITTTCQNYTFLIRKSEWGLTGWPQVERSKQIQWHSNHHPQPPYLPPPPSTRHPKTGKWEGKTKKSPTAAGRVVFWSTPRMDIMIHKLHGNLDFRFKIQGADEIWRKQQGGAKISGQAGQWGEAGVLLIFWQLPLVVVELLVSLQPPISLRASYCSRTWGWAGRGGWTQNVGCWPGEHWWISPVTSEVTQTLPQLYRLQERLWNGERERAFGPSITLNP